MDSFFSFFNREIALCNFSLLLLVLAFIGGLVTSISPCNLSVLPLVIGYIAAADEKNTFKTIMQLITFVLGLVLTFTTIGVIAAMTGMVFISILSPYWILFIASILMVFGLNLVGLIEFNFPVIVKKFPEKLKHHDYFYSFIIGIVFALAATPCSTPILAGIMAASTLSKNIFMAVSMLLLFSLGQCFVIILAGLFTSFLKHLKKINRYSGYLTKFSGLLFVLFAAYLYYKTFLPFFSQ